MQRAASLALLAVLAVALPVAASPLSFRTPGEFNADQLETQTAQWALLVFRDGAEASFDLATQGPSTLINDTLVHVLQVEDDERLVTPYDGNEHSERPIARTMDVGLNYVENRPGSLFLVADRINLTFGNAKGLFSTKADGDSIVAFYREDDDVDDLYRRQDPPGNAVVLTGQPSNVLEPSPFALSAEGASRIEWYAAQIDCTQGPDCPTGGGPSVTAAPSPPGYSVTSEKHTYETVRSDAMTLVGQGTFDYVVFGSGSLDILVQGAVRLPLASQARPSCSDCLSPDNQTLSVSGSIQLSGLQMGPSGTLTGELSGDLASARFDEVPVDPQSLLGRDVAVGAIVVVGGLLVAHVVFATLFTRRSDKDPLDNERRRALYGYVVKNPGAHFREALRATGVPAGAGRHHITHLVRAGLLREERHGSKVRLFQKTDRLHGDWKGQALLRDANLRVLHDWIAQRPGSSQKDIVAGLAKDHGWARTATQGRLARLEREGVVCSTSRGRFKLYSLPIDSANLDPLGARRTVQAAA